MEHYLKPEILILVPLLIGLGQLLKKKLSVKSELIPYFLMGISVSLAMGAGFLLSTFTGWRLVMDAVLVTGVCHGLVAAFVAMGVYDSATSLKE